MPLTPLSPNSTIGILGGGQLGRMLAMAAARLGLKCRIYSDTPGPAFDAALSHIVAPYDDLDAIRSFAHSVDAVTYEFENVPLSAAAAAAAVCPVRPGLMALEVAQDRLNEKTFVSKLGIPVAPFHAVETLADLDAGIAKLGAPAILKTRRLGYDGKGQARLKTAGDAAAAFDAIGRTSAVLEGFVDFQYEVSVLIARGLDGRSATYDVPLNTHKHGILDTSTVPSPLPPAARRRAVEIATYIATALDYVGVLGVELFYLGQSAADPLVVNELAPRVHNSGHWTIDACQVSQFENHMRAVAGWPLGTTARHSDAVMTNLIGHDADRWLALAGEQGACLHLYGKNQARDGRKMGHVNRISPKSSESP